MIIKISLTAFILFWVNFPVFKFFYSEGFDRVSTVLLWIELLLAVIMVSSGIVYIWQF